MNKREFIRGKYGEGQGGWCTKNVRVGYGVGVWKANRKEWNYVADQISFVVGEGNMVHSFGKIGGMVWHLCEAYPNLYAIAAYKNASIKEAWSMDEGRGCGNPLFSRSFNDWELE